MPKLNFNVSQIISEEDFAEYFQSEVWNAPAVAICERHNLQSFGLRRADSSDHIVFFIDDSFILKIYRPFRKCFERESEALKFIAGKTDFHTPDIIQTGEFEGFDYLIMTQSVGKTVTRADWLKLPETEQIRFIRKLAHGVKQIHELKIASINSDWAEFVEDRAATFVERQIKHGVNTQIIKALPRFIEENLKLVPRDHPPVFMHSDIHFGNLCIKNSDGKWNISGLFDFGDSRFGFYEYDFLAIGLLIMQGQKNVQREFFKAYGYHENDLDETMRRRLMMLTMLYETADLLRYAMRLRPEAVEYSLEKLEKEIWSFS